MTINEFKKRWFFRYFHPSFFYLPMEACEIDNNDNDDVELKLRVVLYNTYNPIENSYRNEKSSDGKQHNKSCEYFKLKITYVGKDKKEKVVFKSDMKKNGSPMTYIKGPFFNISKMSDGSPLKFGTYKIRILAVYGLGAPPKKTFVVKFNEDAVSKNRIFNLYVNWHLVSLETKTGEPHFKEQLQKGDFHFGTTPKTYMPNWTEYNEGAIVDWQLGGETAYTHRYGTDVILPIISECDFKLTNCLSYQIMNDDYSNELLAKTPFAANPIVYYYTRGNNAFSIIASHPCYDINATLNESFYSNKSSTGISGVGSTVYSYDKKSCIISTQLQTVKGEAHLSNEFKTEDYQVHKIDGYDRRRLITLTPIYGYNGLDTKQLGFYHNYQVEDTKPSLVLRCIISRGADTLDDMTGPWPYAPTENYGHIENNYEGYISKNFLGTIPSLPMGGNYNSMLLAIEDYEAINQSVYYVYENNSIFSFGNTLPQKDISNIQELKVYDKNYYDFGYKEHYYSKSECRANIQNIKNFRPFFNNEIPEDQFMLDIDSSQGEKFYKSDSNAVFFYLYDNQSWESCKGYCLSNFLASEE